MLIVAGHLRLAADKRAEYLDIAAEATRLARQAPGCYEFVQAPDPLLADRIVIYERWRSEAELLAFRAAEPPRPGPPLPEILDAEVSRYQISEVGPA